MGQENRVCGRREGIRHRSRAGTVPHNLCAEVTPLLLAPWPHHGARRLFPTLFCFGPAVRRIPT